jgi:hypothetical protein
MVEAVKGKQKFEFCGLMSITAVNMKAELALRKAKILIELKLRQSNIKEL